MPHRRTINCCRLAVGMAAGGLIGGILGVVFLLVIYGIV